MGRLFGIKFVQISTFLLLCLGVFLIFGNANAQPSGIDCELTNLKWSALTVSYTSDDLASRPKAEASVDVVGCKDKWLRISVAEGATSLTSSTVMVVTYPVTSNSIKFIQKFTVGTEGCDAFGCDYGIDVRAYDTGSDAQNNQNSITNNQEFWGGQLEFTPTVNNQTAWIAGESTTGPSEATSCKLLISNVAEVDPITGGKTPIIGALSGFYTDAEPPLVQVDFQLIDCANKSTAYGPMQDGHASFSHLYKGDFIPGTTKTLTPRITVWNGQITYRVGDKGCDDRCEIAFLTKNQESVAYWDGAGRSAAMEGLSGPYVSSFLNNSYHIRYDCDGSCDTPWSVTNGPVITDEDGNPVDLTDNPFVTGYLDSIKDSPCYEPPTNPNDPSDLGKLKPDCYDLLAPLPGLQALGVPINDRTNEGIANGIFTTNFSLGFWVNRIVLLIIGLLGLFAVIMIVIAGVQYMTTEVIGTKSSAKERIVNALIGLVIALGIFVLLNTINPNLLTLDPDIQQAKLEFAYPSEPEYDGDVSGVPSYKYVLPTDIGLVCPGDGSASLTQVVNSFKNKTTYRWGGKGDVPPYTVPDPEFNRCVDDDGNAAQCHTFCPEGTVCLDCSGFVYHALECAGLNSIQNGTLAMIGNSAAKTLAEDAAGKALINSNNEYTYLSGTGTATATLQPGDMLAYNGHVMLYIGGGKVVDSHSGSGREKGKAIGEYALVGLSEFLQKVTHVIPNADL